MSVFDLAEAAVEEVALHGRQGCSLEVLLHHLGIPPDPQTQEGNDLALGSQDGPHRGGQPSRRASARPRLGLGEALWGLLSRRSDLTLVAPPLAEALEAAQQAEVAEQVLAQEKQGGAPPPARGARGTGHPALALRVRFVASTSRRLRALGLLDPAGEQAGRFARDDAALSVLERVAMAKGTGVLSTQLGALLGLDNNSMHFQLNRLVGHGLVRALGVS